MKSKRLLYLLAFTIVSGTVAYSVLSHTGHNFTEQQCPECHAMTPIKGKRETLKMNAPISYLCGRCHGSHIENSLSHPVDMVPSSVPPADFPLSFEGKMTCSTCHDIHAADGSPAPAKVPSLRRNVTGAELCSVCHTNATGADANAKTNGHMTFAHMEYTPDAKGDRIDALSQLCLSCHDGSLGSSADVQVRSGSWKHGASFSEYDPQGSHPIGIKYRSAVKRGGLRPLNALNRAIRLIDGRVGCPSCHDPFSKERFYLVMSNAKSRLCTECHDK